MSLASVEIFRKGCEESDKRRDEGLKVPENLKLYQDISYGRYGKWNLMDVYHKDDVVKRQKTIINIHGGGWVYGDKELYKFYCMDLAERGFTLVNFSYRLAPEDKFPAAVEDINNAFTFISKHAEEYNIDLNNLFVVGDSAGAQLASQYLAILTNKEFANLYDFKVPNLKIKAVALNCGVYDVRYNIEKGTEEILFDYIGENPQDKAEVLDTMKYINKDFPAAFIMTSYYDFLRPNAEPMYNYLVNLGIPCEYKLYGKKEDEYMGHVFHVNINLKEAKECNDAECEFFEKFVKEEK